jgi:hypothetical protein
MGSRQREFMSLLVAAWYTSRIWQIKSKGKVHLKVCVCSTENDWFLTAFTAIRRKMFSQTEEQLESAEILPELRYHKEGALIIRELLKKESISRDTLYKLVGVSTARKFLGTNIFALHFNSREITFQSTVMKRYCEEHSALWEGK